MLWYHEVCTDGKSMKNQSVIWNCPTCRRMPKVITTLVSTVEELKASLSALQNECLQLKDDNKQLRDLINAKPKHACSLPKGITDAAGSKSDTFSLTDVVSSSVRLALRDEKSKNEVIIAKMPEKKRDAKDVESLCENISFSVKPTAVTRMGKEPKNDRPRPVKVTFPTPFDARAFLAKVGETKKEEDCNETVTTIRCRPCRSQEEQNRHAKLRAQVRKLNQHATDLGLEEESYSLRQNGEIWKFTKTETGRWKRVTEWTYQPPSQEAGNC